MATLTGGTEAAVRLDTLNIALWLTGTVTASSPASMTVTGPGAGFRQFSGSGFAYGPDGLFSAGTVNATSVSNTGGGPWTIAGMAMPVASLKTYVSAGDTAGFLNAVFAGNDTLSGHATLAFNDYLDGFGGHDKLFGGAGNDTLRGGLGNDTLDGQAGIDKMDGGAGDDTYYVDSDLDSIVELAGSGTDTVIVDDFYQLPDHVEHLTLSTNGAGGSGNDLGNRIIGNAYFNTLEGRGGNDTIIGGGGDDQIVGDAGNDSLDGGEGDDSFYGFEGMDTMIGGLGDDYFLVDDIGDRVIELAGGGDDDHVSSTIDYTLPANVEHLGLWATLDIDGKGNSLNNRIRGSDGDNLLDGFVGADTLAGGAGNDTYIVDSAGDVVDEVEPVGDDVASGYDAVRSSISFSLVEDGVHVKGAVEELVLLGAAAISGTGNNLGNRITGNGAANTLTGLDGNDWLNGSAGADKLLGGKGNDTYRIDNTLDVVVDDGGDANDWVESTIGVNLAALGGGQVEHVTLLGTAAINATGSSGANLMLGNTAANKLTGGAGKDSLYGGDGNDTLDGGADADAMLGGAGNDTYHVGVDDAVNETGGSGTDTVISSVTFSLAGAGGAVENLTLQAGAGSVHAFGNALANVITGNEGGNVIIGGEGNDTIDGASGADAFVYASVLDGHDIINGFDADPTGGQDILSLDWLFDSLGVATADRDRRVQVTDRGFAVDIKVDVDGDGASFELFAVTVSTASTLVKGEDVVMGSL